MKNALSFEATFHIALDLTGVGDGIKAASILEAYILKSRAFKIVITPWFNAAYNRIDGRVMYGGGDGVIGANIDDVRKMLLKAFGKSLRQLSVAQRHDVVVSRITDTIKPHY